jgi:hypothetical protein
MAVATSSGSSPRSETALTVLLIAGMVATVPIVAALSPPSGFEPGSWALVATVFAGGGAAAVALLGRILDGFWRRRFHRSGYEAIAITGVVLVMVQAFVFRDDLARQLVGLMFAVGMVYLAVGLLAFLGYGTYSELTKRKGKP